MKRPALLAATAVTGVALMGSGCGGSSSSPSSKPANPNGPEVSPNGDIPDNNPPRVLVRPKGVGFVLKVPEGWGQSTAGPATVFSDKLNSVRAESIAATAAPTAASARAREIPGLARSVKGYAPGTVSTVTRSAGRAVKITYLADSAADPVTGKSHREAVERYEFFKGGREAILTLSSPKGADNVDAWKTVTNSLRWTR